MKKIVIFFLLLLSLYLGSRFSLTWTRPNSTSQSRVVFEIPAGSSLSSVAQILFERELIKDSWSFIIFSKIKGFDKKYQAGDYVLQKNLNFREISDILQHGRSAEIKVTIPEGSTISQIDEILSKLGLSRSGEFERCANFCDLPFEVSFLEGRLFPSTYYVSRKNFNISKFITRLYRNFQVKSVLPLQKEIANSGRSLEQIIIVASMIEREANTEEEMAKISDVIWKRLDEGIHLGIDATTRYELNDWKRPLATKDFAEISPYNTRKNYGLPPTAISNPSIMAMRAAVLPEENDFYYYLHDRSGNIHFSRTNAEHEEKKKRYLY